MFGYIVPRLENLSDEERKRYQAAYCGLCQALGEEHGQLSRFGLTYDMTFLAVVLGSLYETPEESGRRRCAPHPFKPHTYVSTECTKYAADMTVALVYHKCMDNWNDDHSVTGRTYAQMLKSSYNAVKQTYQRQCRAIEEGLAEIQALEHAARCGEVPPPDAAANVFGALLGEVFVWREDFWADGLRLLGAKLGKFVYVMDAALDIDEDRSSGSYNPFVLMDAQKDDMFEDLQLLAADVAAAFEKLPLERDVHALRSVLYAGMWQSYHKKYAPDTKEE